MSELKAILTDVKIAIKESKFEAAMVLCKNALKINRKSYVALAMFGRVCQELGKYEDSKKSLQLCTQLEPDQPPAWQGLSSLHEKCPQLFKENEALEILTKLAMFTNDEEKLKNIDKRKAEIHNAIEKPVKEHKSSENEKEHLFQNDNVIVTCKEDQPCEEPRTQVSRQNLVKQTWNSIEANLSHRNKSSFHVDELEGLLSIFAELTIGNTEQIGLETWLRIGIHYLTTNCIEKAIRSLQLAFKINPNNILCLECLGDAYLERGSHTAALKLYTRVIQLNSADSFYCRTQIAYIKQITGDFLGSMADYEALLENDLPDLVRVVALAGIAEVLLSRVHKYQQQNLFDNVKRDCMRAIEYLSLVASENPHHLGVWKRLSDACALQAGLPASCSPYRVPSNLLNVNNSSQEFVLIEKNELLQLGGRCLAVAVRISNSNAGLWHDLGVNLFLQQWATHPSTSGQWVQQEPDCYQELNRALGLIKKSLLMDASSSNAWNSLGVVASFMDENALAQHAFLKSLEIRPTVEAWTHLGALYLGQRNENLAYEAFSRAQGLDPDYIPCWVGQAMVAESVGHEETFNLFRHTTVLGIHPESCIGYANHVIKGLGDGWEMISNSIIQNASDSMVFYTRDKELDPVGLNMCGILFEIIGLPKSAEKYFMRAVDICQANPEIPDKLKDSIYANYGRILISVDKIMEAIQYFSLIKESNFYSECGTALAKMKGGDLEAAYESYGSALYWLSPDDTQKSYVFVAMALLQYKLKRMDDVKTLLFQSSCSAENSVQALVSLAALGLLEDDRNLFAAALSELDKHSDKKEHTYQISFLNASFAMLKKDFNKAKLILSRSLHKHPQLANLWRFLAQVLLSMPGKTSSDRFKTALAANTAASTAMAISQATGEEANVELDVTFKALAAVIAEKEYNSSASSSKKQRKTKKKDEPEAILTNINALVEAQRSVLMCPSHQTSWILLLAALKDKYMKTNLANVLSKQTSGDLHSWIQGVLAK